MKYRVWVAVLGMATIAGCSMVNTLLRPGSTEDKLRDIAVVANKTLDYVEHANSCDELEQARVSIDEELTVGGGISVRLVTYGEGLMMASKGRTRRLIHYLNKVGRNLGSQSQRPQLDWTFGILKTRKVNAFAAPGGFVFVSRGLLEQVENEAQLAGVLAHEIAHVTLNHSLRAYAAAKANSCRVALAGQIANQELQYYNNVLAKDNESNFLDLNAEALLGELTKFVDEIVQDMTIEGFQKSDELEADALAVELMLNAGYDPTEYRNFLGKISGGATHPSSAERQQKLVEWETNKINADDPFSPKPGDADLQVIAITTQLRPIR